MSTVGYNPAAAGGIISPSAYWAQRAAGLLGISDLSTFGWSFDDFEAGASLWTRAVGGAEVIQADNTRVGGWMELRTGAVAAAAPTLVQGDAPGGQNPAWWTEDTGGVWYLGIRLKFLTAVSTAQTTGGLWMRRPTGAVVARLGKVASEGTFTFSAAVGSNITSGVAVDTGVYVLEAYRVSGLTTLVVNGTQVGTGNTFPDEISQPVLQCTNGTDAVDRAFVVDWIAAGNGSGRAVA